MTNTVLCPHCSKPFEARHRHHRYCTEMCHAAAHDEAALRKHLDKMVEDNRGRPDGIPQYMGEQRERAGGHSILTQCSRHEPRHAEIFFLRHDKSAGYVECPNFSPNS